MSTKNNLTVDALDLTIKTDDPDVIRTYKLMWERAKSLKPSTVFDPLNLFESDEVGVSNNLVERLPNIVETAGTSKNLSNIGENYGDLVDDS